MSSPLLFIWNQPEVKRLLWLIVGWLAAASITLVLAVVLMSNLTEKKVDLPLELPELVWTQPAKQIREWNLHTPSTSLPIGDIEAQSLFLVNETTGQTLAWRQADQRLPIASTTKIMTAIVALEYGNLSSLVRVDGDWLKHLPADSTMMGLSDGEQYTMEELLYGLLLSSGNDAAMVIASAISPSEEDFVALMNDKAKQLGLSNTSFTNPVGLDDPNHYSTARELTILSYHARQYPAFRTIVASTTKHLPYSDRHKALSLENLNTMVGNHPGVTGIKPGNTGQAGNCLVVSYSKNGVDYLAVLLDTPARSTNMARLLGKI